MRIIDLTAMLSSKASVLTATQTLTMLKRSMVIFSTSLMLSSVAAPAQAVTVYKFVRDGIVTYTQLPPQDVAEVNVLEFLDDGRRSDAGQLAGKTNNEPQEQPIEQSEEQQRIAQLEAEMQEQKAKDLAEQCQLRRYDLTNLNSVGRIFELDENGQKKFLNDRQVEQKRDMIEAAINQYCN